MLIYHSPAFARILTNTANHSVRSLQRVIAKLYCISVVCDMARMCPPKSSSMSPAVMKPLLQIINCLLHGISNCVCRTIWNIITAVKCDLFSLHDGTGHIVHDQFGECISGNTVHQYGFLYYVLAE